ncbi:AlbA family DNA-binding domain-containing protein [Mycobacterium arosiense]|jgi:hypothetical protein|uniref:Schlafen AlbA-2 domain-containing protein n=1 Tax=Mycobacterium arosiense ATCC BAA-1401 = DSM 45069 TaxID=1265311 RepID=A0A1W9Z8B4_MYCAI|nr:hypothetical protein [Mycobacterium arosiense]ORA09109.1 hypothetical protein BST14_22670 [Mycobacterium arosiense ATCC BAA-1401 = DSM 45069]
MSLSTFDKTRASRTEDELRALVDVIHASPLATQETNWLEWKCLDLGATDGVFAIAKTILGFANRAVAVAELACEGVAYMVVGVEPQSAPGITAVDHATLGQKIKSYLSGPRWTPHYVEYRGSTVLVIVVEPPRNGDRIFALMKEFTKGTTSFKRGTVFHRGTAETEQAGPGEIDMLADRCAASAVAADMARLADAQDAWKDAEHSRQARAVGIVPAQSNLGRTGWRVGNSSDHAVTNVRVRTAIGGRVTVYHGSGPEQVDEHEEAVVPAHSTSQLTIRPADSEGLFTDPSEAGRLQVTFEDANGHIWERIGSQLRELN